MAKQLLLGLILENAGLYVEEASLGADNLTVGLLSGKVELKNLRLKKDALLSLTGAPLLVEKGHVNSITVDIPWTSLGSSPVKVIIDGVFMEASPMDPNAAPMELLRKMEVALRAGKLQAAEDSAYTAMNASTAEPTQTRSSYLQQVVGRIIDNLEIHFTNVHIRYTDTLSVPRATISGGLLLQAFSLQTTDAAWTPQFIDRESAPVRASSIYKLGRIKDLGLYWLSSLPTTEAPLTWDDWLARMAAPLRDKTLLRSHAVLPFDNELSLRMVLNELHSHSVPKFDMSLTSTEFIFQLSKAQFDQMLAAAKTVGEFERVKQIRLQRPSRTPREDPRAWWAYTRWRITGRSSSYENLRYFEAIIAGHRRKAQYTRLVKEIRVATDKTTPEHHQRLQDRAAIEQDLPLATLLYFRQIAMKELSNEEASKRKSSRGSVSSAPNAKAADKGSLFTWFQSKPAQAIAQGSGEQEVELADLQQELEKNVEADVGFLALCRLQGFVVGIQFTGLTGQDAPIALIELGLSAHCEFRADATIGSFDVTKLAVVDQCSRAPAFPHLLCGLSKDQPVALHFTGNMSTSKTTFSVRSEPLQLIFNDTCVQSLLRFLAPSSAPSAIDAALYPVVTFKTKTRSFDVTITCDVELSIELDAPIFVFPQSNPTAFLVLDMGHLSVALQSAGSAFLCTTRLAHVRAGISTSALHVLDIESEQSRIIKPFDVSFTARDNTFPLMQNTALDIAADDLYMGLDAAKLKCLVSTYQSILSAVTSAAPAQVASRTAVVISAADPKRAPSAFAVSILLPSVAFEVIYELRGNYKLRVAAEGFSCRATNEDVVVRLKAVAIQDYAESVQLASLLAGFNDGDKDLMVVAYAMASSCTEVQVGSIEIGASEAVLSRLAPFVASTSSLLRTLSSANIPSPTMKIPAVPSASFALHRIALNIYRPNSAGNKYEHIYSFALQGFVVTAVGDAVKVTMDSFGATDERDASKHKAVRALVSTTRHIAHRSSDSQQQAVVVDLDLKPNQQTISAKLFALDIFVDLNVYFDLIAAVLEITGAVTALTGALSGDQRQTGPKQAVVSSSISRKSSLSLRLDLASPRIFFLQNAASSASAGLCFTASIGVQFDTAQDTASSTERLQLRMDGVESFILLDASRPTEQLQVIYPFNASMSSARSFADGKCITVDGDLSVDAIGIQVTLRDLFLMLDIIAASTAPQSKNKQALDLAPAARIAAKSLTTYSMEARSMSLDLMILNDCRGQVHPMMQLSLRTSKGLLTGSTVFMQGSCEASCAVDFFNSRLNTWEPMVEQTSAYLAYKAESDGSSTTACNVIIDEVQLNVSSLMIKSLNEALHKYNTASTQDARDDTLYFQNALGEPIAVYDAVTKALIMEVSADAPPTPIPLIHRDRARPTHPGFLDIVLTGRRIPMHVKHLAVSSAVDLRSYRAAVAPDSGAALGDVSYEEVLEHQRYSLQSMKWLAPFLLNDPAEWTDASGAEIESLKAYPLVGGVWTSPWEVVLTGTADELDPLGFEYNINFGLLTSGKRARQSLDVVRRRRWRRSKRLYLDPATLSTRVFTSTEYREDGAQIIKLESGFRIVNLTSLALQYRLQGPDASAPEAEFAAEAFGSVVVPLTLGTPSAIRFCLEKKGWSFAHSISDCIVPKTVELISATDKRRRFICVSLVRTGEHWQLVCAASASLTNHLPFDLQCKLHQDTSEQLVSVPAGGTFDLYDAAAFEAHLKMGELPWSDKLRLSDTNSAVELAPLYPTQVQVAAKYNVRGTLVWTFGAKAVLVNHCEMDLSLRTRDTPLVDWKIFSASSSSPFTELPPTSPIHKSDVDGWITGEAGVRFISHGESDVFHIGTSNAWSEALSLTVMAGSKVPFEISRPDCKYQLAYVVHSMDGFLEETRRITVLPKFRILNAAGTSVLLRSTNAATPTQTTALTPNKFCSWSPIVSGKVTTVHLKTEASEWSLAAIDLLSIGSYDLLLPSATGVPELLHIEVTLAPSSDLSCYISVIIWQPHAEATVGNALRIRNTTDLALVVIQSASALDKDPNIDKSYRITVPARSLCPFAWVNPALDSAIKLSILDHAAEFTSSVLINMSEVGSTQYLINASGTATLQCSVVNETDGKVLLVSLVKDPVAAAVLDVFPDAFSFFISLKAIGVSVIAEKPVRREILALSLQGLFGEYSNKGDSISYVVKITDYHADNYLECNAYPVLLRGERPVDAEALPLVELFIEAEPIASQLVYRSFLVRLLEIKLYVDATSIQLLLVDFYDDVEPASGIVRTMDAAEMRAWTEDYRRALVVTSLDAARVLTQAQRKEKIYIENIVIHPIKLTLNFTTTQLIRDVEQDAFEKHLGFVKSLGSVTSVNDLVIRITSFIACNVLESREELLNMLFLKVSRDLQDHLLDIASSFFGKLDAIGRPADLFAHIGGGVSDFFYEPYQGLMKSPKDFAHGLGKGTKSLLSGLVSGTVTSAMTIVENASLGAGRGATLLSEITGDTEMVKKREEARRKNEMTAKGALGGLSTGASSVFQGFSSGLTGLVTKPMEGGKKGGALGFLKGVGQGVIGVAVSPIVGVTDGIAAVAHGFSTQVTHEEKLAQLRGPRVFRKVREEAEETHMLQLVPMNKDLLAAGEVVKRRASLKLADDSLIARVSLGAGDFVVISGLGVTLQSTGAANAETSFMFAELSHFKRSSTQPAVIEFYTLAAEGKSLYSVAPIDCKNKEQADAVFEELLKEAERVFNPTAIV